MSAESSRNPVLDEILRQLKSECENSARLRDFLVTTQTGLERSRSEASSLKSELDVCSTDAATHKTRSVLLEAELTRREETINSQNTIIKQLENSRPDRDALNAELAQQNTIIQQLQSDRDALDAELINQKLAFEELLRKNYEQEVQARALEAEILSLKAKVLVHKRTKPVRKYLAAVSTPPERPQETAEAPQATETKVPPSARQAVVKSQPVASTSQASPSSIVIKPEIFEEEDDWILDSDSGALTYLTPVPESRRQELQVFPEFVPDADCSAVFTRQFLSNILGGSIQPLIVNLTANRKALAEERNINRFLCVNWRNNSWAPPLPGQHGFMFVGLGTERDTFLDPEELNVFLSIPPKGKGKLEVSYLGRYEVHRVSALSVPEWQTLPRVVQRNYIDITAARGIGISGEHKSKTHANIRAGYDSGALMVPCVRLICTGFDERLYDGLVAAYPIWCKERETSDGRPSAKRRRTGSI